MVNGAAGCRSSLSPAGVASIGVVGAVMSPVLEDLVGARCCNGPAATFECLAVPACPTLARIACRHKHTGR
jgi:hypothetical protein